MKKMTLILVLALGPSMVAVGQTASQGTVMTGTLCAQKCVKQIAGKSACDSSCSEKSGEILFIDDEGKATKVANPGICDGKIGKKVKIRGEKMKGQNMMQVYDVWSLIKG